jgi:hypothetical protein
MSTEHMTAEGALEANDATRKNGSHHAKPGDFVRRAKVTLTALPGRLDEQVKTNPYAMLAIAAAVGAGVGIVLSSRIVRSILTSAATVAAVELARAFLRQSMSVPSPAK